MIDIRNRRLNPADRRRKRPAHALDAAMGIPVSIAMMACAGTALAQAGGGNQPVTLDPVVVEGRRADPAATEGTGSYATGAATVGSRDAVPVREIPRSVSVVTRQRMDDQNMTQLEDAFRRTPGTLVLSNDPGRSSIYSRGFELDNFLVDGLPAPLSSIYGTQPDLAIFDRVEILRGPSGLLGGTGEPGGTVNLARKRPQDSFGGSLSGSLGSWNNRRIEGDVTGPLVESGKLRGRAVGVRQDRDTFVDKTDNEVTVGYGALEADLTESTTLSAAAWRQERDIKPFNGLPAYANGELLDVSRSTFIGADWNRFENRSNEAIVELRHRFDNGGHAQASARYVDRDVDFKYAYAGGAVNAAGNTSLVAIARDYSETALSADAHVSTPFELLGRRHDAMVGAEYRRYEQRTLQNGGSGVTVAPVVNIFDPRTAFPEPNIPLSSRTRVVPEQYGIYGQLRLRPVEPLTAILGGRASWYEGTTTNLVTNARQTIERNGEITPFAGLVYDLTDNLSAYVSYSEIFQPQTNLGANGSAIAPRTGHQYEAGLKSEFFEGRMNGQVALFRLRDDNRAVPNPSGPGSFIAGGEVEVQGLEAEISGSPYRGLQVFAGYALTDTSYIKAPANQQGTTFSTFTPRHSFNLWTRYDFPDGELRGLNLGLGGRYFSSFYNLSGSTRFEEDGYVVVDARIGYDVNENLELSLNANNIFDEKYYTRVGSAQVFNFYGEPRSFIVKATARF
ncbi:TonB-dependent siderophore receptor [Arenibaculum pallidiluteum]|uniref:TonB-dependent siderophore receptor n=1 Tax=Arenibaculum pallidiluteum TaxID=2812559 RepID=UPI001A96DE5B|nr:TonB-dependent siderophore receptor [Arenibaculum pallidiluteum]